jgi:transposase InsO family protein
LSKGIPKGYWLPFLVWCISGSRAFALFLVEAGAAMIVASVLAKAGWCPRAEAGDTFSVATLKGVGRIYQQTFINTDATVAFAKLYDRKTPITAAELVNDRVIPFFDEHEIPLCRVLTDRGTEYCGNPEPHEYELYLTSEDIDHTRTTAHSPQTNGICERFHKCCIR